MIDCFAAVVVALLRAPSVGVSWRASDWASALETTPLSELPRTAVSDNQTSSWSKNDAERAKNATQSTYSVTWGNQHPKTNIKQQQVLEEAIQSPPFTISTAVDRTDSVVSPSKVLLLHYHKTGHELSRILAVIGFNQDPFQKLKRSSTPEDVDTTLNETKYPLIVGSALALHQFEPSQLDSLQIIHFVRDPYDWVRSAYQYHSQKPIPVLERGWLDRAGRTPPCTMPSHLKGFASEELGLSFGELKQIEGLCQDLRAKSNEVTHYRALQALSIDDGMRIEAARGLLGIKDHGDLMRMAQNLHILTKHQSVETVFLSQLTTSRETFDKTAATICSSGQHLLLVPSDRSVQECVAAFRENGFIGGDDVTTVDPRHVTAHKWTTDEKKQRLQSLLRDPILGGPLQRVHDYMMKFKRDFDLAG